MAPFVVLGSSIAWAYNRGGSAWTRLSWILGLERIGIEVFVVDQIDLRRCTFSPGAERVYENALNLGWFDAIVEEFGLSGRAALIGEDGQSLRGPSSEELQEIAASADALVNLSGDLRRDEIKNRVRRRILVDTDPGLTHFWLAAGRPAPRVVDHDLYFTVGENVGRAGCSIPSAGIDWRHVRQPVLLDEWPVRETPNPWRFTTVAKWRGVGPHGRLSEAGLNSSDKGDEFLRFSPVALRSGERFEVAVDDAADPRETEELVRAGWSVTSAQTVTPDPESFRRYVQGSGAEFSVAKGVYVDSRSGWFSDRTTRYLASGKPALVQDTGFDRTLPVGDGLIAFCSVEDAVAGARAIAADYDHHARSARQLAEQYFAADLVLGRFMDEALSARIAHRARPSVPTPHF
jgi:hypothetical protein